jgi:hypothetical protein
VREGAAATPPAPAKPAEQLAVEVMDAFLDWSKLHQAEKTYTWHRGNIQHLTTAIPSQLTVAEMKPFLSEKCRGRTGRRIVGSRAMDRGALLANAGRRSSSGRVATATWPVES